MPDTLEGTTAQAHTDSGVDLAQLLRALRRRAWVITLMLVVVTGGALGLSLAQQKQYTASTALLFRDPGLDEQLFNSSAFAPSTDPTRQAATNVALVSLRTVADRTAARLHNGMTGEDIASEVTVTPRGQSDVVDISATDPSPRRAATLANALAEDYITFRRDADRAKIRQAEVLVERQLADLGASRSNQAERRSLQNRAEQLQILSSLQTGNAELVQPATAPTSPSSPRVVRNTIVGGILGLALGLGLALLLERLDRRIKDVDELEEIFGLPVLSAIPESRSLADAERVQARGGGTSEPLSAVESETFRMLRARLRYFNVDRDISSLLITSSAPQDGKTTISWHLGLAAASTEGAKVLILESDLRRPAIAKTHNLRFMPGLAEVLTHRVNLEQAVQTVPIAFGNRGAAAAARVDVIVSGAVPPNPAELLESDRMAELLKYLATKYDLVLIDTAPASVVSDGIPLMKQVSGVLVVCRLGKTTRDAARHLRDQLTGLGAPTLGVVANRARSRTEAYYGYRPIGPDWSNDTSPAEEYVDNAQYDATANGDAQSDRSLAERSGRSG
jgi:capsular exopolysaccharide synthesis family protein